MIPTTLRAPETKPRKKMGRPIGKEADQEFFKGHIPKISTMENYIVKNPDPSRLYRTEDLEDEEFGAAPAIDYTQYGDGGIWSPSGTIGQANKARMTEYANA